jgi:tetratricopeptide (TPR) repeat protein
MEGQLMIASTTVRLAALVLIATLLSTPPVGAASYTVEGFTLGARAVANADFSSYACKPSDRYANVTRCQRAQRRGPFNVSATVVNVRDGAVLYAMATLTPVTQNRAAIDQEIASLTRQFGEQPVTLNWLPPQRGQPMAAIATWGGVKLEPLPDQANGRVVGGEDPRIGMLVDPLGDPTRSAKLNLPVFRALGGGGFVFSASFDAGGRGHRQYMAVDGKELAIRQFEFELEPVLQKDRARPASDLALWAEVAKLTRRLALDTSAATANDALDRVYERFPSKKFRSHVWALLPGGAIEHMEMHQYGTIDIYGPKTEHPRIRADIEKFLADPANAREPFREFLLYVIGEPDQALAANPNSVLSDVFYYASGHRIVGSLLDDAMAAAKPKLAQIQDPSTPVDDPTVDGRLRLLNRHPELFDNKLLGSVIPNFASRADAAKPRFEFVLRTPTATHADDAAYMLGWLAFHRDQPKEALTYLSRAMEVGNAEEDYKRPAALKQAVRILERYPPREQAAIVGADRVLVQQPAMWYAAARSAYREFDYPLAVDTAERALKAFNIPPDKLPPTTDPKRITDELEHINADFSNLNLDELPYLIEASKEFQRYVAFLKTAPSARPDDVLREARRIIIKYSMLLDLPQQPAARQRVLPPLAHKDLRQALHLIDLTLAAVPGVPRDQNFALASDAANSKLREWLYYRKARILAVYAPQTIADTIAAMQREYPTSQLMDDALAEQLYAQGVMLRDVAAAEASFRKLIQTFPRGNAVDNAYTWMAIIYRCEGREQEAQNTNREIIRLFPRTRHAAYAHERMAGPSKDACGL